MAFDIGGRIVLEDAFSATFSSLSAQAGEAEQALKDVGAAADEAAGAQPIEDLSAQFADLAGEAASLKEELLDFEVPLDTDEAVKGLADFQQRIVELESAVMDAERKMAGGAVVTPEGMASYRKAKTELAGLKTGLMEMAGAGEVSASKLLGLVKMVGMAGAGVIGAVGAVAGLAKELAMLGLEVDRTKRNFETLASLRGVDSVALIGGLQEASRGAVASAKLMAEANKIILGGGEELASQLPALFEAARASAELTGQSTIEAFQKIVAGVQGANEATRRAQGLSVNLSAANRAWADANDRTVESLNQEERAAIAANAAIAASMPLIADLGLESRTTAENLATMPMAISELKGALGELIATVPAVRMLIGGVGTLADQINEAARITGLRGDLGEMARAMKEMGDTAGYRAVRAEMEAIDQEALKIAEAQGNWTGVDQYVIDQLEELKQKYLEAGDAAKYAAAGLHVPLSVSDADAVGAVAEATSTFQAALDKLQTSLSGVEAMERQFASAIVEGNAALANMPQMPDITAVMDVDKLREWGAAWLAINPNLREAYDALLTTAAAMEAHQAAILVDAAAISDMDARVRFLVTAFLGADATIDDFAAALGTMPPELLAAIGPADELAAAIARVRAQAGQPITLDVMVRGYEQAIGTLESLAVRWGRLYGPDQAQAFYDQGLSNLDRYWAGMEHDTTLGQAVVLDAYTSYYDAIVSGAEASARATETAAETSFSSIAASAGELQSMIESALMAGSTVTAEQMAATLAGAYEDVPLEAAKRLDAIAERGFAELQAHPDWAGLLKIPPDVLAGSEAELKSWAKGTAAAVRDLTRPDLIDWGAFIENLKQDLRDKEAKQVTIDMAVTEVKKAGLLEGKTDEEIRKEVLKSLGLEEPEFTMAALFKTQPGASQDIHDQVGEIPPFDVWLKARGFSDEDRAAILAAMSPPDAAVELPVTPTPTLSPAEVMANWSAAWSGEEATMPVTPEIGPQLPPTLPSAPLDAEALRMTLKEQMLDPTDLIDLEASTEALKAKGLEAARLVQAGAEGYFTSEEVNVGQTVAAKWGASFAAAIDSFKTIGLSMGKNIGDALLEALDERMGQVLQHVASLVAPEVAAILGKKSGALP